MGSPAGACWDTGWGALLGLVLVEEEDEVVDEDEDEGFVEADVFELVEEDVEDGDVGDCDGGRISLGGTYSPGSVLSAESSRWDHHVPPAAPAPMIRATAAASSQVVRR